MGTALWGLWSQLYSHLVALPGADPGLLTAAVLEVLKTSLQQLPSFTVCGYSDWSGLLFAAAGAPHLPTMDQARFNLVQQLLLQQFGFSRWLLLRYNTRFHLSPQLLADWAQRGAGPATLAAGALSAGLALSYQQVGGRTVRCTHL